MLTLGPFPCRRIWGASHWVCARAGAFVVHRYKDSAYGLTLIWAFVAVYGRQHSATMRIVALSCTAVTFMFSLASVLRRRQTHHTELADMRTPLNRDRLSEAV